MIVKPITLYTPVEINKERLDEPANVRPYSIQKYRENPFQESKTSVESLTDQKKKIIIWLKTMSILQRKEKFAFQCSDFVSLLRVMFERRRRQGDRSFRITQEPQTRMLVLYGKENTYRLDNTAVDQAEEELIGNVVLLSYKGQFDTVSLSQRILTSLEKLFDIFEVVEDGVSNELSLDEYRSLEKEGNEAFFYRKDETDHYKKSLGKWLIEVLKKKLWCEYYRKMEDTSENRRTRQKKKFNKAWKEVSPCQRRQYLKFCSYASVCQAIECTQRSGRVRSDMLLKTELPDSEEFVQFMDELIERNDPDIHEYLSQCTLEEAGKPINLVKFSVLEYLKEYKRKTTPIPSQLKESTIKKELALQTQKKKKTKCKKKKSDKVAKEGETAPTTQQSASEHPKPLSTTPVKISQPREKKEFKTDSKQQRHSQSPPQPKFIKRPKQKPQRQDPVEKEKFVDSSSTSQNNSILGTPQKPKRNNKRYVELQEPPVLHHKYKGKAKSTTSNETNQSNNLIEEPIPEEKKISREELFEKVFMDKQRNDLVEVADSISECANSYGPYRMVAFNRILYLLRVWSVGIKVFGSCATGLALANSDIDVAVDPSILNYFYAMFCSNKQKVSLALNWIMRLIENRPWVSNLKLITTATVPVLKFEINPNIPFDEAAPRDLIVNTTEKERLKKVQIKVDLTIESFYLVEDASSVNHLGIMATNSMKEWIAAFPSLHTVTIVLKDLLKRRDLNNIYKGGISSYALVIMIIAYMHTKHLVDQKNPATVFYGFLDFLCKEFQHEKFGVDINPNNPSFPFFELETPLPGKIQVRDPLNNKIVTCNSFQYQRILSEFALLSASRQRLRQDLQRQLDHLPPAGKYFTRNYLQQLFHD